jgi:hypothetical protein
LHARVGSLIPVPAKATASVEGTGAYAGVSESKQGWSVWILVVRSENQPEFVTFTEAPGIGYERNPVAQPLANRQSFESPPQQDWGTGLVRGFVHFSQASAEIPRCDIDGFLVFVHIL